jgi:molybdopterin-guanine dinucleotide biosynthesis protein A
MWPHTVAILMGGTSSRMGTPKHEVVLPTGKTMMETMLDFALCTATNTVIVGGDINGQRCIHDRQPGLGPIAGLESLLISNIDIRYLVVGCDMPLLKTKTVQPLFVSGEAVCFYGKSKKSFPTSLPLVIGSECSQACSAYLESGKRSLHGFLQELSTTLIKRPHGIELELSSINTREQLNSCTFK